MAKALSNLTILSEEFIHRHGPELLEKSLKPKVEHILLMRLSDLQHTLYDLYIKVSLHQTGCIRLVWKAPSHCLLGFWPVLQQAVHSRHD